MASGYCACGTVWCSDGLAQLAFEVVFLLAPLYHASVVRAESGLVSVDSVQDVGEIELVAATRAHRFFAGLCVCVSVVRCVCLGCSKEGGWQKSSWSLWDEEVYW